MSSNILTKYSYYLGLCTIIKPNKLHQGIYQFKHSTFYSETVLTYLIKLKNKVLLIDFPDYTREVHMLVTSFKLPVMLFLTHGSCATDVIKTWKKLFPVDVYLHQKDIHHPWLMQLPDILFDSNFCVDNRIEIIHTLGHSHGSICLLDKASKFLFSGDTICGNKSQKIIDFTLSKKAKYEDFNQQLKSWEKLLEFDFDAVYPFHHFPILNTPKKQITEFLKLKDY